MKNDLAEALKEKKALEKEITKQEEKYDHKIAKLKDKNYKLKDKLEDKESEVEKLESKLKKLKETYHYDSDDNDDDDDESEDDSDDDSSVNIEYVCEHKVETIHEYLREFLPDTTTTDTDTPDEKFEDEEATLKDIDSDDDDDSQSGSSRSDELEEVIEDMTEERTVLQSRIEELERKLKKKDDESLKLKKTTIKKSTSETTETDDDNVSVTTDDSFLLDADKLNLVSGQESEYSWITKTPSSETVERSSGSEHEDVDKRDVNNNVVLDCIGTVPEPTEKPHVKITVTEPSEKSDIRKTAGADTVQKPDDRDTAEESVAITDNTGDDVQKEKSNADQAVKV